MDKRSLRIVYMGTPDFAVGSLKALVEGGYNVVGVITMPDKPAGRGHKIQFSPVKEYALSKDLPLLQPEKLKDTLFLDALKTWNADLQIVVAFRMLPEAVWDMPRLGTFNLHASLLPQYRGAAPINWAVINGEKKTGVSTFFLTHEIDTGKIIFQQETEIRDTDNVGDIHDRLMNIGASLVTRTVDSILNNTIQPTEQIAYYSNENELKPAPKIFKETCRIDWDRPVEELYNFIRGLSPYPAAWTEIHSPKNELLILKIFESERQKADLLLTPGTIVTDKKSFVDIAARDGFIRLKSIQLSGKKRMAVTDFLNGFPLTEEFYCLS